MVPQIRPNIEEESGLPCAASQNRQEQLQQALQDIDEQVSALRAAVDHAMAQYEVVRHELRQQGLV